MNRITDLLDLKDANVIISDIQIQDRTKTIFLKLHPLHISVHPVDFVCTPGVSRTEPLLILFFRIIIL